MKNRIREIREERGLTQQELATDVGVSRESIYAWERGSRHPSLISALCLSDALTATVEELFPLTLS